MGPRVCPGQRRALIEGAYVTARLLQSIQSIESHDDRPFQELLKVTLLNGNGVRVALRR
jgi:cytochrome P450